MADRIVPNLLVLVALTAAPFPAGRLDAAEAAWEVKAQTKGVTVQTRARQGSGIRELKSVGEIDAPPPSVLRVLIDLERYREIMPYTEESRVVATEERDGTVRVWHFYTVINAPLVSRRDYTIRVEDESDWRDGDGFLKTRWTLSDRGPAPRDGIVHVKVNDGSWLLEPLDGGRRTRATYTLFTDPGGAIPAWLANKANSSAIPDIFVALRKWSKDPRYAGIK